MPKRKQYYAVVGLFYPRTETARKKVLAGGGTGAFTEKLIERSGADSAATWFAENYVRVEAGQPLAVSVPGTVKIGGKRTTVEKHWLATGRISASEPQKGN